jgi:site-specific DNA-methyltransferase (adenine-specific)
MKVHEDVIVFSRGTKYFPQKTQRRELKRSKNYGKGETMGGNYQKEEKVYEYTDKFPESILEFSNALQYGKTHPTQKPIPLFRYLIKTYTKEGDLVLDNCMGSGTTAVACKQINRNFIGCDISQEYVDIANKRLNQSVLTSFPPTSLDVGTLTDFL